MTPSRSHPVSPRPKAPDARAWDELARSARRPAGEAVVDVIVPIYRGYDDTLACLHSVLASTNATPHRLTVIDDACPEIDLAGALDALAARGLIDLVRNDANRGFVRSANLGMARHLDRDVLLLNSDTIVYGDWLDRLRAHRLRDRRVATITPWSNNATLLSYPATFANNDFDLELDFAELDALIARELGGEACELPTGVGFCLYVARECLADIGLFDSARFGRGYGEENDFCLRAAARGWRNIAACDVFVRHTGKVSFGADAAEAQRRSGAALAELHPGYMAMIGDFMRSDPLRPYRERLDAARLRRWADGRLVVRFDDDPGPAEPAAEAERMLRASPAQDDAEALALHPPAGLVLPNLPSLALADGAAATHVLSGLGVAGIAIGTIGSFTAAQARFARTCAALWSRGERGSPLKSPTRTSP